MKLRLCCACVAIAFVLLSYNLGLGQKKLKRVPPAVWGGVGVQFTVAENSVTMEYDCAVGEISGPLMIDKQGHFTALGSHRRLSPGPIRLKFQPKARPARYEGTIASKTMRYRVVLTDTGETVGPYSVERGVEARIRRCR
jgi:hypothetical protein